MGALENVEVRRLEGMWLGEVNSVKRKAMEEMRDKYEKMKRGEMFEVEKNVSRCHVFLKKNKHYFNKGYFNINFIKIKMKSNIPKSNNIQFYFSV